MDSTTVPVTTAHNGPIGHDAAAHHVDHALEHADKAGAGAHDDRYLAAHRSNGKQLHQGDQTGHQHGILQQHYLDGGKVLCPAGGGAQIGDDKDGGQVTHKHGQHMLKPQGNGLTQGKTPNKIEGRHKLSGTLHDLPP